MKRYSIFYIHYIPKAAPERLMLTNLSKFDFIHELDRIHRDMTLGLRDVWKIDEDGTAHLLTRIEITLTRKFMR